MRHYKREYSEGSVKPYRKRGKTMWRATISEYTTTEVTDERGRAKRNANGSVVTERTRRVLNKVFGDLPCEPRKDRYRYDKDGKLKYTGQRQAEEALRQWRGELEAQASEDYEAAVEREESDAKAKSFSYDSMAVGEFLDLYVAEREEEGLEPSTIDGYRYNMKYAKQRFAGVPVGEMTTDMMKDLNKALRHSGLSATTRNRAIKVCKFAWDAHRDQISSYPFENLKKWSPKSKPADPNPLDPTSKDRVLADLSASPSTQFMCAVELSLRTGMRVGEVSALRWVDVDMETGNIDVCRAIGRCKGGTVEYLKGPKDTRRPDESGKGNSRRFIPGSEKLQALFNRRFDHMVQERMRELRESREEAEEAVADGYVVGDAITGKHASPTVLGRTWRGYSQNLMGTKGRRPTFHSLRDTWISQAITKAKSDPVTVSKIVGHSDPGFTMRTYADSDVPTMMAVQAEMDNIL